MSQQNDWGVYKEGTSPELWVKDDNPLELSSADQAISDLSEADANTLATDLTNGGEGSFAPGRPKRKPPVQS